jgi:hypothetical protein
MSGCRYVESQQRSAAFDSSTVAVRPCVISCPHANPFRISDKLQRKQRTLS